MHIRKLLDNGRKRVNQLHKVISNRNINLSARRLLLLSVIRPSIEYGSEVWEGNKSQAGSLESIILDGAKQILGCSSKTCNEAVRGDIGLDTLQSRRDRAKLKWWYKLATSLRIGTQSSCLIRSGILNHVEEGRGKCGVGWWMISLNL